MKSHEKALLEHSKSNNFFQKYSLIWFFLMSYALITIAVLLKSWLGQIFPEFLYWIISAWSPTISAIIISGLIGGKEEVKLLLRGLTRWRVHWKWYFAAFLILLAPLGFALIYIIAGGVSPGIDPSLTVPLFLYYLLFTLFSGPLSEETGWRGFALPRLQSKYNALLSSIILGFIWAFWHLPLYLVEERIAIYIFIPLVLVISILMTWVYNNSNGSLILTIIMHFSFNFDMIFIVGYLGLMPTMIFYISASIAIGIYLIGVIIYFGPEHLSKKAEAQIPRKYEK
ncbi:MAG: CPBP family intramembrane metalloprotease [Candidatus Lokiarchaeota archaeon]|nr:CPBP family intramembrane metalloprotease [Candidatus Lokiarchaeota archaeon]